jgi:deoxyribonuclease-4
MSILGAHMSIAGGYYKAVEIAHTAGCDCVQLFTKNNNQWAAKELTDDDTQRFRAALDRLKIRHPIAHDSYLINLASPDPVLWKRSVDAFVIELLRAERLGIPYVVTHPGSYTSSSEEMGLAAVVRALDEVHAQTPKIASRCLLEVTAGQGTNLGCKFEHLASILDRVADPDRLGVCFDTCHAFAAGYPMGTEKEFRQTFRTFDQLIGTERIKAFHLNDSVKGLGSRVDRHAHIGEGQMGVEPFRLLLADRRFRQVPMYLETPKGTRDGMDLDVINLRTLRSLGTPAKAAGRRDR